MNNNTNKKSGRTQNVRILNHLQKGRTITALQAFEKFQCLRLASRINDLKNAGHKIDKRMVRTKTGKHVAQYRMEVIK